MATNNAVNNGLTGATGTGSFVGSTSPVLVTPTLGAASATSLTFTSTTGLVGTTTNDSAASGSVGQITSSVIAIASAISISTDTSTDLTSISLTAGDWDVWGNICFTPTGAFTFFQGWSSSTSATLPDASLRLLLPVTGTNATIGSNIPMRRYSLSVTTTVYLSGRCTFTTGSTTFFGGIYARRRR